MSDRREYVADFHTHSHYSRATSKQLTPEYLNYWARIKGVHVVATGDITHPSWLAELKEKLEPAEEGLFRLRKELEVVPESAILPPPDAEMRFILSGEISNIYKKAGKVRKVHNVVCLPSFERAEALQARLDKIGNITSDGRPILGIDSKDLLELCLEVSEEGMFIPAHVWTPWFSALGAKSGFDSLVECYEELTPHLAAVEMGLSTNPAINWMCSFLDDLTLLANSDAHSPEKLGRNANLIHAELSYAALREAVVSGDARFAGTISFFPQEGKYHFAGHRKCGVRLDPVEAFRRGGICPACGKPMTEGVIDRVVQLSDREDILQRPNRKPAHSLIPLKELLGELMEVGPSSKKVARDYQQHIQRWGTELSILRDLPLDVIEREGSPLLSEAIRRVREGEVLIEEGYDGEYGRIRVFAEGEKAGFTQQGSLFGALTPRQEPERRLLTFDLEAYRRLLEEARPAPPAEGEAAPHPEILFNAPQRAAIDHDHGPALILAGPGTGKTRVLVQRVQRLVEAGIVAGESILAITFTNKAAGEMRERLARLMGEAAAPVTLTTFHALGLQIIREQLERVGRGEGFALVNEEEKALLAQHHLGWGKDAFSERLEVISALKQRLRAADEEGAAWLSAWDGALEALNLFDLDDLLAVPLRLFEADQAVVEAYRGRFSWVLVDEYQDVNRAQYELIRLLAPAATSNLFAIGDPNQAIYGFRGADVGYIRRFREDYPGAAVYQLDQSYRCPEHLLRAAGDVLALPEGGLKGAASEARASITRSRSDKAEAEGIARKIEQLLGGVSFFAIDSEVSTGAGSDVGGLSEIAVLCRMGRQMKAIEKALQDHHIPYRVVGAALFFRQEPVKSLLLRCRAAHSPDNPFLRQQVMERFGLGEARLRAWAALETSRALVEAALAEEDAALAEHPDVRRLLELCDALEAPQALLDDLALGTVVEDYSAEGEAVSLMTLHASKGLEFDAVFIPGCEQGLIPYSLFESQVSDVDEERRLLYVGMTRAKKRLFLSHAERRFLLGEAYELERSPFLASIRPSALEAPPAERKRRAAPKVTQLSLL